PAESGTASAPASEASRKRRRSITLPLLHELQQRFTIVCCDLAGDVSKGLTPHTKEGPHEGEEEQGQASGSSRGERPRAEEVAGREGRESQARAGRERLTSGDLQHRERLAEEVLTRTTRGACWRSRGPGSVWRVRTRRASRRHPLRRRRLAASLRRGLAVGRRFSEKTEELRPPLFSRATTSRMRSATRRIARALVLRTRPDSRSFSSPVFCRLPCARERRDFLVTPAASLPSRRTPRRVAQAYSPSLPPSLDYLIRPDQQRRRDRAAERLRIGASGATICKSRQQDATSVHGARGAYVGSAGRRMTECAGAGNGIRTRDPDL